MNWGQIAVATAVIVGVVLLMIIGIIGFTTDDDKPDYLSLWQDAEVEKQSQELNIIGYQSQLDYLMSALKERDKKMDEKVTVRPWFDELCKQFVKDQLNLFARCVNAINTGNLTSTSGLPKWMHRLPADEFNDLWENFDKYAKALKNGYVVEEPRKAFKTPWGEYVADITVTITGKYAKDILVVYSDRPIWLDDDSIGMCRENITGEVVKEDDVNVK